MTTVFLFQLKNPNIQTAQGVDALILGMASQIAENEDNVVIEDLRGRYFSVLIQLATISHKVK